LGADQQVVDVAQPWKRHGSVEPTALSSTQAAACRSSAAACSIAGGRARWACHPPRRAGRGVMADHAAVLSLAMRGPPPHRAV